MMHKVYVPEVIDNGNTPMPQQGGLVRWFRQQNALVRYERQTTNAIAKIQSESQIIQYEMKEAAQAELLHYQLEKSIEVSKHKIDMKVAVDKFREEMRAKREKILIKVADEYETNAMVEDFLREVDEQEDPLHAAQHRVNARRTTARERKRAHNHPHTGEPEYPWRKK
jgi:hypothetical protein